MTDLENSFRRRPGSAVPPSSLRLRQLYGANATETLQYQRVTLLASLGKEGLELLVREAYYASDTLGIELDVFSDHGDNDEKNDAEEKEADDAEVDADADADGGESFSLAKLDAAETADNSALVEEADEPAPPDPTPPAHPRALLETRRARAAAAKVRHLERRVAELEEEKLRNQREGKELGDKWAAQAATAKVPESALKKVEDEAARTRMREDKEQQDRRARARDFGNAVAKRAPDARPPSDAVAALLEKRQQTESEELARIERKKEAAKVANERSRRGGGTAGGSGSADKGALAELLAKRQQTKNEELARLERRKEVRDRANDQSLVAAKTAPPTEALRRLMEQRQQTRNEELARIERRREACEAANEISKNWKKVRAMPNVIAAMRRRATVEKDERGEIVPRPPRTGSPAQGFRRGAGATTPK